MTETLLLRMPENDRPASWLVVDAFGNRMGQSQAGTLAEAIPYATGRRLRVIVPGATVMLLHANIPSHNTQRILQAVPFALEDKLAQDVDTLHFAVGARDTQGYPVAVVTRTCMQAWLNELASAGLVPTELTPDMLALPVREHTLILVPDGQQLLARFPDATGIKADTTIMPMMIRHHLSTLPASESCTHAFVYSTEDSISQEIRGLLTDLGLDTTYHPLNGGAIALMVVPARDNHAINLLQGEFGRHTGVTEHWHRWRIAVWLSMGLCLTLIIQQGVSEISLRYAVAGLNSQVEALFHQALPGVTHMVDPKVQIEQRLKQLNGVGDNSQGFLNVFTAVGNALQSQNDVQLQSFSYHDGNLQLQVQAGNIDALNNIKNLLAQNSGLQVAIDSLNSSSGTTTGRLTITGGGK